MSCDEARKVAEALIGTTDLRGYGTSYSGCRRSTFVPHEWDVVFDVLAPGGHRLAGGIVVVVDGQTGVARME